MKISSCLIVKNERHRLDNLLSQLSEFSDQIVFYDTGSTDGTIEYLENRVNLGDASITLIKGSWEYDFSIARNNSFSHADHDFIFWCDADDELTDGLISTLNQFKSNGDIPEDAITLDYIYPDNSRVVRSSLLRKSAFKCWMGFIHEFVHMSTENRRHLSETEGAIIHRRSESPGRRNLDIFERKIAEGYKLTDRDKFYYANELWDQGYGERAVEKFDVLIFSKSGWIVDLWNAAILSYDYKVSIGDHNNAYKVIMEAFRYGTPRPDITCRVADYFFKEGQYITAIQFYEYALKIEVSGLDLNLYDDKYGTWYPYLQLSVCYDKLGHYKTANQYNEKAGKYIPNSQSYLHNKEYFKSVIDETTI